MRKKMLGTLAAAALVLSACGGDDDGGGAQDEVADMMIESFKEDAGELADTIDEDCIRDATGQLSDDDAQKILDAGPDGDPDVSEDAIEASIALMECIDFGAMLEEGFENLEEDG